jgi:hypothetical protein
MVHQTLSRSELLWRERFVAAEKCEEVFKIEMQGGKRESLHQNLSHRKKRFYCLGPPRRFDFVVIMDT